MELVDLSHTVEHGMVTYPGLPGPEIGEHLSFEASHGTYAEGTEFAIGRISMVANTGTYLDTPAHRYRHGHDLSGLDLGRCADLRTVVIDGGGAIDADVSGDAGELEGAAVLFRTGWDANWGQDAYGSTDHPYLTEATAAALVAANVALVGIDSVNIDATATGERPIHSGLLAAGVPPKIRGMATFTVRAFALIP